MTEKLKLKIDPRNARIHPERNLEAVGESLDELGAGRSIVVDRDGIVIGGNAVYEKAVELGLETRVVHTKGDKLIVVVRDDLATDDPKRKALALADNQIATLAEWDELALEELQTELLGEIDLDVMGFDLLDEPIEEPIESGELIDRAEELQKKWQIKRGQVWEIPGKAGVHRVMCGDSTDAGDVALLLAGEKSYLMVTDPPYGMNLDTDWSDAVGAMGSIGQKHGTRGKKYDPVIGDDKPFDPGHLFEIYTAKEMFLFGADYYAERIPNRIGGSWLVWDKRKASQSEAIGSEFELVWSKCKHKRRVLRHDWFGFLSSDNVQDARHRLHPTQKPVSLIADIICQWGKELAVADPYLGSGTTVVAAEQEGRIAFGCEIEPKYIAVTLERLSALGLDPVIANA